MCRRQVEGVATGELRLPGIHYAPWLKAEEAAGHLERNTPRHPSLPPCGIAWAARLVQLKQGLIGLIWVIGSLREVERDRVGCRRWSLSFWCGIMLDTLYIRPDPVLRIHLDLKARFAFNRTPSTHNNFAIVPAVSSKNLQHVGLRSQGE
jgi:hypothetical protein